MTNRVGKLYPNMDMSKIERQYKENFDMHYIVNDKRNRLWMYIVPKGGVHLYAVFIKEFDVNTGIEYFGDYKGWSDDGVSRKDARKHWNATMTQTGSTKVI
tara:strand:- start:165 stop:467 length:303 start_codon:yes stop_codon:yes gene_type:complete